MQRIEPQHQRERQLRRRPPVRQQRQLVPDQRPVPDQLVFIQRARHGIRLSRKPRPPSRRPPQTLRIRSILTAHPRLTWSDSNPCTWLHESYRHPVTWTREGTDDEGWRRYASLDDYGRHIGVDFGVLGQDAAA